MIENSNGKRKERIIELFMMYSGYMAMLPAVAGLSWILPAVFPPLVIFPDAKQLFQLINGSVRIPRCKAGKQAKKQIAIHFFLMHSVKENRKQKNFSFQ